MDKNLNILIVDDNKRFIKALKSSIEEVLINRQHNIDTVQSGEDALLKIEKNRYNFIFMDINMPGIGGISAIRQADNDYYRNKTMIIAVSFHNELEFVEKVLGAGARKYLVKDEITEQVLQEIFMQE